MEIGLQKLNYVNLLNVSDFAIQIEIFSSLVHLNTSQATMLIKVMANNSRFMGGSPGLVVI